MIKIIKSKYIEILSLVTCVISLSLSLLSYSTSIIVKKDLNTSLDRTLFDVNLSTEEDKTVIGNIYGVTSSSDVKADIATIYNTEPTSERDGTASIVGLKAHFTEPGQYATYTFYSRNDGKYAAYLKNVEFKNAINSNSFKVCTPSPDTTSYLVDSACNKINISVQIRDSKFINKNYNSKKIEINDHILGVGDSEQVVVTISYDEELEGENARADGDFEVTFGDIVLTYLSNE